MNAPTYPVFDGHNDTLLRLVLAARQNKPLDFLKGTDQLHIDLPKARKGGFAGGFFAMFTPSEARKKARAFSTSSPKMGDPIRQGRAEDFTDAMIECAEQLAAASNDLTICKTAGQIQVAIDANQIAILLHIEGAEVIGEDFAQLDTLYDRGLRSIGPVWSRHNIFANGVPFSFPGSPDQGAGLTDLGKELVRRCNQKGIMLDTSHLNEKGFWDIAKISTKPIVATHSNAHVLCASPRNLSDEQLEAIAASNGIVGLNFATGFLRADGRHDRRDVPLDTMMAHLDHMLAILGEDGVALGSDFDGCALPNDIGDVAGLPNLIAAMEKSDYGTDLIAKITHKNWISLLDRTLNNEAPK